MNTAEPAEASAKLAAPSAANTSGIPTRLRHAPMNDPFRAACLFADSHLEL
jgi:hypothetical protein